MSAFSRHQGFTLIEMLLSMAIMTAVVSLASYSYRFYLELSTKTSSKYDSDLERMQLWQRVTERISENVDYYISPKFRPSERNFPLFMGEAKSLYSVTSRGIFERSHQALYWLGESDGDLMYCEKAIVGYFPTEDIVDDDVCHDVITLESNVSGLTFRYFGWSSLGDWQSASSIEGMPNVSQIHTWFVNYQGRERYLTPNWIEISYEIKYDQETKKIMRRIPIVNHDPDRFNFYLNGAADEG